MTNSDSTNAPRVPRAIEGRPEQSPKAVQKDEGIAQRLPRGSFGYCVAVLAVACGLFSFVYTHTGLLKKRFTPSIQGWDDSFYYFWLRAVMVRGDLDFAKDIEYCDSLPEVARVKAANQKTPIGRVANKYPIGWAVSEVPWYLAADGIVRIANLLGAHIARDGWGPIYQGALLAGQEVYAAISLWFACQILLSQGLQLRFAASGLWLMWLASSLFVYQTRALTMAHNILFFSVTAAYYSTTIIVRKPERRLPWVALGAACALTVLSRYQGVPAAHISSGRVFGASLQDAATLAKRGVQYRLFSPPRVPAIFGMETSLRLMVS